MMKKLSTLIIIVFFTSQAIAQFTTNWFNKFQHTTAFGYSHEARKVATDATGNIFELADVTSDLDSSGHQSNTTNYYVILRKLNSAGTVLTNRTINVGNMAFSGGHDYKASYGLELDASNNVYIGYTKYNASGNFDVNVAKYNNALSTLWTATYATGGHDYGVDMELRGTTAFALVRTVSGASTTNSIVKFDGTSPTPGTLYSFVANSDVLSDLTTATGLNIYVTGYSLVSGVKVAVTASINPVGTLKWQKTFNHSSASGDDYGSQALIGTDGDIYVSGTTYTGATEGNDVMLLHYGAGAGTLKSSVFINLGTNDNGSFLANGPANSVFITNDLFSRVYYYKVSTLLPTSVVASGFYAPVPSSPYTTITGVTLTDMKVSANYYIYLCGTVTATSSLGNLSASFLTKIGAQGSSFVPQFSNTVEGTFSDSYSGVAIALDPVTSHVITLRNYWATNTGHTSEKIYLTSLSGGTLRTPASEITTPAASEISFYPNPASGSINFISDQTITSVELSDLTGKIIITLKPEENKLDISTLKPGLYLARVITSSGVTVKRIVIQ